MTYWTRSSGNRVQISLSASSKPILRIGTLRPFGTSAAMSSFPNTSVDFGTLYRGRSCNLSVGGERKRQRSLDKPPAAAEAQNDKFGDHQGTKPKEERRIGWIRLPLVCFVTSWLKKIDRDLPPDNKRPAAVSTSRLRRPRLKMTRTAASGPLALQAGRGRNAAPTTKKVAR